MIHLDFQVALLDVAATEAVVLGATVTDRQPQESVRVPVDQPAITVVPAATTGSEHSTHIRLDR